MCVKHVIPFLFGSFFTVCHPYIDVHFVFSVTCIIEHGKSRVVSWEYGSTPYVGMVPEKMAAPLNKYERYVHNSAVKVVWA